MPVLPEPRRGGDAGRERYGFRGSYPGWTAALCAAPGIPGGFQNQTLSDVREETEMNDSALPKISREIGTADKLAEMIRLVWTANAAQSAWMYSMEYRIGKYVCVTRRPSVIERAYEPADVTGKDVRVDDLDELEGAIRAVREDMAICCA